MDESIVKSAAQGVSLGVGVRVISGERTGYAYTGDLSPEKIRKAAICEPVSPWLLTFIRIKELPQMMQSAAKTIPLIRAPL